MTVAEILFVAAYLTLMAVLSVIAVHRLCMAVIAYRRRSRPAPATPTEWPTVLVQVPLYNERFVAERVIDAVCRLDYPADKLTIQILDDSTDGTRAIAASAVNRWRRRGVAIEHVCRNNREAFKAGALAYGLRRSTADLVAVFDADFEPPASLLRALVPEFGDPGIGMVQARWGHSNREESPLTQAEAILLDGHFANEHGGRFARGCFFNFNGTAGIWRRTTIDDAGGWSGATLTEDLDLSYRAQLRGWRFIYRGDIEVPGELPADVRAFKSQQHRWAKGSIQTALLLWRRIVSSELPFAVRFEAMFHLAANFAYPLVLALTLLMPWAIMVSLEAPPWLIIILDSLFFVVSTCAIVSFYLLAERKVAAPALSSWYLPVVLALGIAMAVNNTRAVLEALFATPSDFNRTPKLGGRSVGTIRDPGYFVRADWQALIELAFGGYLLGAVLLALSTGRFIAVPFMALFAGGFLFLSLGSLWHGSCWRSHHASKSLTASAMPKRI
jgi:cellulose synthase/poly-beta-1,6-N-acetylglucosamine synthase-like glycosyltransferase